MDTFRLDIDGTICQVSGDSDDPLCPHVEVPPFTAFVSSIYTDGLSLTKPSTKQTKCKTTTGMSSKQYNILCWKVVVILVLEIGILLSVLVLYTCRFYDVIIEDNKEGELTQTVGLFRYSLPSSSKVAERQCIRYSSIPLNLHTFLGRWLQNAIAMLAVPQVLSTSAPVLAALSCGYIGLQVYKPRRFCGQSSTSAMLFLAALFQALSIISFDGQSTW
jgi:hypothetical protein